MFHTFRIADAAYREWQAARPSAGADHHQWFRTAVSPAWLLSERGGEQCRLSLLDVAVLKQCSARFVEIVGRMFGGSSSDMVYGSSAVSTQALRCFDIATVTLTPSNAGWWLHDALLWQFKPQTDEEFRGLFSAPEFNSVIETLSGGNS